MYNNLEVSCNKYELFKPFEIKTKGIFPATRYQGSKNKLVKWIEYHTKQLSFQTVIDAFGGTGCVAHMFKSNNKRVIYNDILKFNYYIGLALIENSNVLLEEEDIKFILTKKADIDYPSFVSDTFKDIYFTDNENKWLDFVITNISYIKDKYKQALAYYALFQSCIIKRPYNLFHRKNLYIRTADVKRSFGNKASWDTSFDIYFRKFADEANKAVFSNGRINKSANADIFKLDDSADLVYIDTPYISQKGNGVNYLEFYHFLEGLTDYDSWEQKIDTNSKHKKIKSDNNIWNDKNKIAEAFDKLFKKYQNSIFVVSYRSDGIPSIDKLTKILSKYKKNIEIKQLDYKYVLSQKDLKEVLIIAK
ncbi:MAG: DNA adenine methylase [Endomicrobium sp.]|jgi:adenine-specific DNA methylase|nr:DNA adenine methylase [Endomicrobium sp.]